MGDDHAVVQSTTRPTGPVTGSFARVSPDIHPNGRLAGPPELLRGRRSPASRLQRMVRTPVAPPPGHDVPGVTLALGGLTAYLRKNLALSEGTAAYRAWITPEYRRAIENGKCLPSLAVFIMPARAEVGPEGTARGAPPAHALRERRTADPPATPAQSLERCRTGMPASHGGGPGLPPGSRCGIGAPEAPRSGALPMKGRSTCGIMS